MVGYIRDVLHEGSNYIWVGVAGRNSDGEIVWENGEVLPDDHVGWQGEWWEGIVMER